MTAVSMIFGVLPVALALGEGAEARAPMAIATAGGMTTSTFLTLFVVPVVYALLDRIGGGKQVGVDEAIQEESGWEG